MRLEKPKPKHRKGLWSPDEDEKLRDYILRNGHGSWSLVPSEIGLQRNGKSCRLRWINYLRPGLKRGTFSKIEEEMIFSLHRDLGNKWSQIAQKLPGRTDNEIKNYWHTHIKKRSSKIATKESQETGSMSKSFSSIGYSSPKSVSSNGSHHASSTYTNPTMHYSSSNNGYSEYGPPSTMPKVIFEEWLSSTKLNAFDDQLSNVFTENTLIDNNDQLVLLDGGSVEFETGGGWENGVVSFPDYLGVDHRPPGEFSSGSFADFGICSGFSQTHATSTSDVMYPWNL